jgi:SAM-dependent methyltransferase
VKSWALDTVCCPATRAPLSLADAVFEGDEIVSGQLVSPDGRRYPITRGIPRLTLEHVSVDEERTIAAFGKQWDRFQALDGYMASADLFFEFFPMLTPGDIRGRTILDAGCGMGRFMSPMLELGAARVVGIDYSASVEHAQRRTAADPRASVVQGSILAPPLRPGTFDLVFSAGVIDHLDDPGRGVRELSGLLALGGRLAIWIYAREGNETYLRFVKPLRDIGPRLPAAALHALSRTLAMPAWLHSRTLNRWVGVRRDGTFRLPMAGYFQFARRLSYRDLSVVIYDQLSHPLAEYMSREQAESLFREARLSIDALEAPRRNSWSLAGRPA